MIESGGLPHQEYLHAASLDFGSIFGYVVFSFGEYSLLRYGRLRLLCGRRASASDISVGGIGM